MIAYAMTVEWFIVDEELCWYYFDGPHSKSLPVNIDLPIISSYINLPWEKVSMYFLTTKYRSS